MTAHDLYNQDALASTYLSDETRLVVQLTDAAALDSSARAAISASAEEMITQLRSNARRAPLIDALMQEYDLSSDEGIALMRLSEALIRTPDFSTAQLLMRDKLQDGRFVNHQGASPHPGVEGATLGLRLASGWIKTSGGLIGQRTIAKLGDRALYAAISTIMGMMASHFVLGRTIDEALDRADKHNHLCSFDMLGEAARSYDDADRYFAAYLGAAQALATHARRFNNVQAAPSLSVKLSALHPRYEYAKRDSCTPLLIERMTQLAKIAKNAGFSLTIDAEEADRLEASFIVVKALLNDPALDGWDGLGVVVQAYQRRAFSALSHLLSLARASGRRIAIRLVKGAYWDMEIKRAQELGLESYPVFTRKEHTDISYLACTRALLNGRDVAFPQFATHNAHTIAAILHMAGHAPNEAKGFELQRLHGMGESLHEMLKWRTGLPSRVYAPVGAHKDLLPYLVRRLLENGANSSFVNQFLDPDVPPSALSADPIAISDAHGASAHDKIPAPRDLFGGERLSAKGLDLTQSANARLFETPEFWARPALANPDHMARCLINGVVAGRIPQSIVNPAFPDRPVGTARLANTKDVEAAVTAAKHSAWRRQPAEARARIIAAAADALEARRDDFLALCVREAGKTLPDAVAELREAVDFCRYYANQAQMAQNTARQPLGLVACVSPWNFPLAIFLGQVTAALSAGNCVIAKPAEQTPLIAYEAVRLLHEAGVPADALHLLLGDGGIGAALTRHDEIDGICFTGSTATAKKIAAGLGASDRPDRPLIAETGGINVMIIDSTALLEQAVQDVIASAFQSAGQRCSACRIVCVQDDIADEFISLLRGAMATLSVGDPAMLATDLGPVIDKNAHALISAYISEAIRTGAVIAQTPMADDLPGHFIAPTAIAVDRVNAVTQEIFGPVLHIARFDGHALPDLIDEINALGFGLTMGLHTRIDARVEDVAARAHIGNIYVNRNQIGAVVGVQPFGGEGLSGTGPKAGGPNYLLQLSADPELALSNSTTKAAITISDNNANAGAQLKLKAARRAARDWGLVSIEERCAQIEALVPGALPRAAGGGFIDASSLQTIALPGPTGEANTLSYFPRGVVITFGGDEGKAAMQRQIALALLGGNTVLAVSSLRHEEKLNALQHTAAPGVITAITSSEAICLIGANIDGVVADGADRTAIAPLLAQRSGAILPLLSESDAPQRFCCERTLTINTTAAGGNAHLLSMG